MTRAVLILAIFSGLAWTHVALATSPRMPEQRMCDPSAFVIASVTGSGPSDHGNACDVGSDGMCSYNLTLTAKVEQILAKRPPEPGSVQLPALNKGETISTTISVSNVSGIPADWMHASLTLGTPPLSREATVKAIRGHNFIFGIGGHQEAGEPDQIWSMDEQARIEKSLLRDPERAGLSKVVDKCATVVDKCATLDEQKQLEDAAAREPPSLARLLALAAFHERIEDGKALALYRDATAIDQNNEALNGFIRTLGMGDTAWTIDGLEVAHQVLLKDPKNLVARRLLVQSSIHSGETRLVDGADLSLGKFESLDLSGLTLPGVKLSNTFVERLQADGAKLQKGDLSGLRVKWSELRNADLSGVRLDRAKLGQAAIEGADFGKSRGRIDLSSRSAGGASFQNADLSGGSSIWITQGGVGFPLAPFYGVQLDVEDDQPTATLGSKATVSFSHARLSDASLRLDGLKLDFTYANLTNARFSSTDLRGADFAGAMLDHTSFNRTVFDCTTVWPKGFRPEQKGLVPLPGPGTCKQQLPLVYSGLELDSLNFAGLDLRRASFQGMPQSSLRLVGADLSGVDLRGVDFSHAMLQGANLKEAQYDGETRWPRGFDPAKAGARICKPGSTGRCR